MRRSKQASTLFLCFFILLAMCACSANKIAPEPIKNQIGGNPPLPTGTGNAAPILIPPTPTPPVTAKRVGASESDLLGGYQTRILDRERDRVNNIILATSEINGIVLKPGDTFSFNAVLGRRTVQDGYRTARIIVNGEYDEGVGGGICQVSSTLFNAVDRAGLKILERHSHTKKVGYVPIGQEAAVNYGTLDFKFKNTRNTPIEIRAVVKNRKVIIGIWKKQ